MEYLAYSFLDSAYAEAIAETEYDLPEFQFQFTWNKQFKSAWLTFAGIGVLFAILAQAQAASAAYYGTGSYYVNTNGSNLNVRSGPSFDYPVVASVRNGGYLKPVIRYSNGFAQLSSGNWVWARWISTTPGSGYSPDLSVGNRYLYYYGSSYSGTGGRSTYRPRYKRAHYGSYYSTAPRYKPTYMRRYDRQSLPNYGY